MDMNYLETPPHRQKLPPVHQILGLRPQQQQDLQQPLHVQQPNVHLQHPQHRPQQTQHHQQHAQELEQEHRAQAQQPSLVQRLPLAQPPLQDQRPQYLQPLQHVQQPPHVQQQPQGMASENANHGDRDGSNVDMKRVDMKETKPVHVIMKPVIKQRADSPVMSEPSATHQQQANSPVAPSPVTATNPQQIRDSPLSPETPSTSAADDGPNGADSGPGPSQNEPAPIPMSTPITPAKAQKEWNTAYDKNRRSRAFLPHWLVEYPWLQYSEERQAMYCFFCCKYRQIHDEEFMNTFVQGATNFRLDSIKAHENSARHKQVVLVLNLKDLPVQKEQTQSPMLTSANLDRGKPPIKIKIKTGSDNPLSRLNKAHQRKVGSVGRPALFNEEGMSSGAPEEHLRVGEFFFHNEDGRKESISTPRTDMSNQEDDDQDSATSESWEDGQQERSIEHHRLVQAGLVTMAHTAQDEEDASPTSRPPKQRKIDRRYNRRRSNARVPLEVQSRVLIPTEPEYEGEELQDAESWRRMAESLAESNRQLCEQQTDLLKWFKGKITQLETRCKKLEEHSRTCSNSTNEGKDGTGNSSSQRDNNKGAPVNVNSSLVILNVDGKEPVNIRNERDASLNGVQEELARNGINISFSNQALNNEHAVKPGVSS